MVWLQAIDTDGYLYTWGGDGNIMLGHSDRYMEASVNVIPTRLAAQRKLRFKQQQHKRGDATDGEAKGGRRKLGWRRPWLRPRRVCVLGQSEAEKVWKVSCGIVHTAALTVSGHVYVCGENTEGVLGNGGSVSEHVPRLLGCSDAIATTGSPQSLGNGISGQYVTTLACGGW
jgi:alpha-tubulin suppressor-like RCC1 family protein